LGQELTQDGPRARIERQVEVQVEAVIGAVAALPGQRKAVRRGCHRIDLDFRESFHDILLVR
jgi:hypothetical protein